MIDFGWFLPTMGESEIIGPPGRHVEEAQRAGDYVMAHFAGTTAAAIS